MSRALARVDLAAIAANCARLRNAAGPESKLCAVVKADAYGHGMVEVANAALAAGASQLAVAAGSEALALRNGGVRAPILVMGALESDEIKALVDSQCDLVTWTREFSSAASTASTEGNPARLHVKLDTGMGRLGTSDKALALDLAREAHVSPSLVLAGAMTHFATADDPAQWDFAQTQLQRFTDFAGDVKEINPDVVAHAANSAATLALEGASFDMVRCGVAVYGMDPFGVDPAEQDLRPSLELSSHVAAIKEVPIGGSVGYGRRFIADRRTTIATVPIGYADGFNRLLGDRGEALVNGKRAKVVGNVSMDNITIDLGDFGADVAVGDEVLLIGQRGDQRILIEDLAREAQTINYEIATGIGGRTERSHHG